jgi:hypothetical protein
VLASGQDWADLHLREAFTKNFRRDWIDGYLRASTEPGAVIRLGTRQAFGALASDTTPRPLELSFQVPEADTNRLSQDRSVGDLFENAGRALLVLGGPGSGKTITLLELAAYLLQRAERDSAQPLPAIIGLSSWTDTLTFSEWLARQLNTRFGLGNELAHRWLTNHQFVLLLDGLDEVRRDRRDACVAAVNKFLQENGWASGVAITCRAEQYDSLTTRVSLRGAIVLEPLTRRQIDEYLAHAGHKLAGLRAALSRDESLRELALSPLMLRILSAAYYDRAVDEIAITEQPLPADRRAHIWQLYIEKMLEWREIDARFTSYQLVHGLAWLARQMSEHSTREFILENIHPAMLHRQLHRRLFSGISLLLIVSAFLLIITGGGILQSLILGNVGGALSILIVDLCVAGLVGVISALSPRWLGANNVHVPKPIPWSRSGLKKGSIYGVILGTLLTAGYATLATFGMRMMVDELRNNPAFASSLSQAAYTQLATSVDRNITESDPQFAYAQVAYYYAQLPAMVDENPWLLVSLAAPELVSWFIGVTLLSAMSLAVILAFPWTWSWTGFRKGFAQGLVIGSVVIVALLSIVVTLLFTYARASDVPIIRTMFSSLFANLDIVPVILPLALNSVLGGAMCGIAWGIVSGFSVRQVTIEDARWPNHAIWRGLRNCATILVAGLVLSTIIKHLPLVGDKDGIAAAFMLAFAIIALKAGGAAWISHFVLRGLLCAFERMPSDLVGFLDRAVDVVLMQRVGARYIFVHGELQEHFASMSKPMDDATHLRLPC